MISSAVNFYTVMKFMYKQTEHMMSRNNSAIFLDMTMKHCQKCK